MRSNRVLRYSVHVQPVPIAIENVTDLTSIRVCLTTGSISTDEMQGEAKAPYIAHDFSLARIYSDSVRNGTPLMLVSVDESSLRGPSSPAGKISICRSGICVRVLISPAVH